MILSQMYFLASLVLVIHAGPILKLADKDEATAEVWFFYIYNTCLYVLFVVAHNFTNESTFSITWRASTI